MARKRALISVSDKKGVVDLAKALISREYELITTDGTNSYLKEHNIPSITVEEITGFKASARVKTLHPTIYQGILEDSDQPIDIVVCNLYPFEKNIDKDLSEIIELIDIGGVSLIRAASKNFQRVSVVIDPDDYQLILDDLIKGCIDLDKRKKLAMKAFSYVAYYDSVIAQKFGSDFNSLRVLPLGLAQVLKQGENLQQKAWLFLEKRKNNFIDFNPKTNISYNNLINAHTAYRLVLEFESPCCAVVKHCSPCSVGMDHLLVDTYSKAQMVGTEVLMGSTVGFNCPVDEDTAVKLCEVSHDSIIAPAFSQKAMDILQKVPNLKIISSDRNIFSNTMITSALGGMLFQEVDSDETQDNWQLTTDRKPSNYELEALLFAWRVCKWVKSKAIVLAIKNRTIAIASGAPTIAEAVEIALKKSGVHPVGMVLASDVPFTSLSAITGLVQAGVSAIIQPGGWSKDEQLIQTSNQNGLTMICTGTEHLRH